MKAQTHADPGTQDGRNVDPKIGVLSGEASQQEVREPLDRAYPTQQKVEHDSLLQTRAASPTYYDLPAIKEPVWKAPIPLYFYVGGLAGGAGVLAAAAELFGGPSLQPLVRRCRWIAMGGAATSAGLLIWDLGLRSRFINMLRVFRPTSPMNIGTWILSGFGGTTAVALLFDGTRLGRRAGIAAGVLGAPLATYTAVLISNTAVPVWQGARRQMPLLFAASAGTSIASLLDWMDSSPAEQRVVRRFGLVAKSAELIAAGAMKRQLSRQPRGAKPLDEGLAGALWKAAEVCTAASLALSLVSTGRPSLRKASGILGTIGSLAIRLSIFRAGTTSARDPRATFEAQRAGLSRS